MNRKRLHSNSELIINKKHKYKSCAIILMGLPGSGKSYLSPKIINHINIILDNEYQYINLNPDNIIINKKYNCFQELSIKCKIINKKLSDIFKSSDTKSFIYDGTGSNKSTYNFILKNCEKKKYHTFLIYVKSSLEKALERNQNRSRKVNNNFITKYSGYIDSHFEYYIKKNINYLVIDNNNILESEIKIINSKV